MIEKERKFILKYLPEGLVSVDIRQAYLMFDGSKHLRVRIYDNDEAYLTFKDVITDQMKLEYEYQININDGLAMFSSSEFQLHKKRYKTKFNGNTVDIDVYSPSKAVVEIEYEDVLTELPPYCGEEVTGVREWSNIWMAKNGI